MRKKVFVLMLAAVMVIASMLTSAVLGTVTGGSALLDNPPTEVTVHG